MGHFKKYFKKGIVIIVIAMLIIIPNMSIYSSVGSYKTHSQAIIVNNNHKLIPKIGRPSALPFILGVVGTVAFFSIIGSAVGLVITSGLVSEAKASYLIPNKAIDKNYDKYDFSQFDR